MLTVLGCLSVYRFWNPDLTSKRILHSLGETKEPEVGAFKNNILVVIFGNVMRKISLLWGQFTSWSVTRAFHVSTQCWFTMSPGNLPLLGFLTILALY